MSNVYLKIEGKTGMLYEQSKVEKEGYEKTTVKNPQTSVESIVYRKYMKAGAFGILNSMSERVQEFDGRKTQSISVALSNGEDKYFIDIPLFDQKKNISSFAESFIRFMPELKNRIGKAFRVYPYAIEDKDTKRKNYGIAINVARLSDEAVDKVNKIPTLTYEKRDRVTGEITEAGDIPTIDWAADYTGTMVPDKRKRNTVLYNAFKGNEVGYTGAGGAKTFDSTATATEDEDDQPIAETKPVAAEVKTPVAAKTPGAIKPSESFEKETNVEVDTAEADDDDLPF